MLHCMIITMRKNVQIDDIQGITLDGFIKNNEPILSALAVISALIVFSKDLTPSFAAGVVSFLLVGGIVLLWLEMWNKFPELVHWRLFIFRYILLWTLIAILFSWLYEYRAFWDMFLFFPLWVIGKKQRAKDGCVASPLSSDFSTPFISV